ncbi:adenylate/guanylate cyclase domain-containing protein [Algoriphagus namhaensis]|uniref:Adenylate/guanylate cyclase domain-containing protein n=1 Tax=Algoriphagus namhaensis TaxID=915353 RepID=A0ABV8AQ59_9BACT
MLKITSVYARNEDDSPDLIYQKKLLITISSLLFLCGVVWCLMWYFIFGWSVPTVAAGLFGAMVLVMIFVSHFAKNHLLLVHSVFLGTLIVPVTCQWSIGSLEASGMIIAWAFLTPLGMLIFSRARYAIAYMIVFLVCILITIFFQPMYYGYELVVPQSTITLFYTMNLITSFSVIFVTCAFFVDTIKVEKRLSEELLLNILPRNVAEELKSSGDTSAKAFTMVTVMFTDFVGFTEKSKRMSAELLVDELHHCFSAFDNIIQKYKVEKIKTIGDAYLCVTGLPVSNYTHPVDMVSAAFEMRDFMIARMKEKEARNEIAFELRIGIHTGPVVAGIVGIRKFQYDIWGDTVNTANRMESMSLPGKINISQTTYELIKHVPKFDFEKREKVFVKGKGEMEMYYVSNKD